MKMLLQVTFLILISSALRGQELQGNWRGTFNVQETQLTIVFHITKSGSHYETMLDSPNQKAFGLRVTVTSFQYPDVTFEIPTIGAVFKGIMSDDGITGNWMQSDQTFPLVLLRSEN